MISLRKEIEVSDQVATRLKSLLKAFLGLTGVLPKTALPADPDLSGLCRENLERATVRFETADIPTAAIEAAGKMCVDQVEAIYAANKAAIEERDADGTRRMGGGKRNTRGTPQGGVASPLLANI